MDNLKLSYEEALKELEVLLSQMEEEGLNLNETIGKFKRAMELYDYCKGILDKAEGEVKLILKKGDLQEEVDFLEDYKEEIDEDF